jgi:hypothetical protein
MRRKRMNIPEEELKSMAMEAQSKLLGDYGIPQGAGPSVVGQFHEDDTSWELAEWMVKIYDMSNEDQRTEYEELLGLASSKDPSLVVVDQERQFCKNSENWKIFVTCALVKYKDLLDKNTIE